MYTALCYLCEDLRAGYRVEDLVPVRVPLHSRNYVGAWDEVRAALRARGGKLVPKRVERDDGLSRESASRAAEEAAVWSLAQEAAATASSVERMETADV